LLKKRHFILIEWSRFEDLRGWGNAILKKEVEL